MGQIGLELIHSNVAYSKKSGKFVHIKLELIDQVNTSLTEVDFKLDNIRAHNLLAQLATAIGMNEQIKSRNNKNENI